MKIRSSIVPLLVFFALTYSGFVVNASAGSGGGPDCTTHPTNPNCTPTQEVPQPTVAPTQGNPEPTECPGASCDDVPGNECEIQSPEHNPHCDDDTPVPTDEPTAEPTAAPTATLIATDLPTATSVPTDGPTPTATTGWPWPWPWAHWGRTRPARSGGWSLRPSRSRASFPRSFAWAPAWRVDR